MASALRHDLIATASYRSNPIGGQQADSALVVAKCPQYKLRHPVERVVDARTGPDSAGPGPGIFKSCISYASIHEVACSW